MKHISIDMDNNYFYRYNLYNIFYMIHIYLFIRFYYEFILIIESISQILYDVSLVFCLKYCILFDINF